MLSSVVGSYRQFMESSQQPCRLSGLFGGFHVPPLTNNSIRYNPFLAPEVSFGVKGCSARAPSSSLFDFG